MKEKPLGLQGENRVYGIGHKIQKTSSWDKAFFTLSTLKQLRF